MKKLLTSFLLTLSFNLLAWDLGIYMQADNNLAPYAFKDLTELSNGLTFHPEINVYIEIDLPGDEGFKRIKLLPKKMQEYGQSLSDFNYLLLGTADELTSQVDRLQSFMIEWGESASSGNKMLVIWGHGEGFSSSLPAQFGGVALDDSPHSKLDIPEIADILKTYELIFNEEIDLVSFDACLMQTMEVAYELKDFTPYVVGSTQIQNFNGLPYEDILELLASEEYAAKVAYLIPLIAEKRDENKSQMTMSSVSTRELYGVFLPQINQVLNLILKDLDESSFQKLALLDHLSEIPQFLGESRDLNTILSYLSEFYQGRDLDLYLEINEARTMLSQSILNYTYGDFYISSEDYHLGAFKAFGIWFPVDSFQYDLRSDIFAHSQFYLDNPLWKQFLSVLFTAPLF